MKPTRPNHVLIDADILVYKYGHACTDKVQWTPESEVVSWTDLEAAKELIVDKVRYIMEDLWVNQVTIVLSPFKKNFRHDLYPEYKANRGPSPAFVHPLRRFIQERYSQVYCAHIPGSTVMLEADDILGCLQDGDDTVIATIDKDLLQIEGWNYNLNSGKLTWVTRDMGNKWLFMQALMGDSVDNYKGIPGIGPKKAEKILKDAVTFDELHTTTLEAFKAKGLTPEYALVCCQLAHIYQRDEALDTHTWLP